MIKWCKTSYFLWESWFKEVQKLRSLHELSFIFHVPHCQEILKALKIFPVNAFSKEMFSSSLNLFWHLVWSPWYEKLKCLFLSELQTLGTVPEHGGTVKVSLERGVHSVWQNYSAKGDLFPGFTVLSVALQGFGQPSPSNLLGVEAGQKPSKLNSCS